MLGKKSSAWLRAAALAFALGGVQAAGAASLDTMIKVPPPTTHTYEEDLLTGAQRYHAAQKAAAEKLVEQWMAGRQAEIDALKKRGATDQQAADAIDERIFLARLAASTGDFGADVSPKFDYLQRKLPILSALSNLGHERFQEFTRRNDISVPGEFYSCLCQSYSIMGASVSYHPEPTTDCRNSAPCKGGNWGCVSHDLPSDTGVWARCSASTAPGLSRSFVDGAVDRVGMLQEKYRKDVCMSLNGILLTAVDLFDGGKFKDRKNHSIFSDEEATTAFLENMVPREGGTEVAVEALIDRLKNVFGLGADDQTGLYVLLTDQDMPSTTGDNPYIFITKTISPESTFPPTDARGNPIAGEKRSLSFEMALAQRIMAAPASLEPKDVFRMALEVTKGDLPLGMLIAHNLLKEAAYAKRLGQPMVIGHIPESLGAPATSNTPKGKELKEQYARFFGQKGVWAGRDFIIRNPALINDKLRDIRPVYDKQAEERLGPWYHMFGLLFVGSHPQLGEDLAELGASVENATRLLNLGSGRDLGKEALNNCAAKLVAGLMRGIRFHGGFSWTP
nr:hypothetical protein [Mesorhizobium sp.]